MTPTDFTNDQTKGYIYTLTNKIRIKQKTSNCLIFIVMLETFAKFGYILEFIGKRMYSLVNVENY